MKNSRLKFISSMVVLALALALVLNLSLPAVASPPVQGYEMYTDIEYTDPDPTYTYGNLLDLYIPNIQGNQKLPLVIWHTGSAWYSDEFGKMIPPDVVTFFTQQGYAVAGVNVRSSLNVSFPGQLLDIRAAIRYLREEADDNDYNLDPNRFAIIGTSSGGWLAAIAATTSDIWELDGETDVETSSAVQAAVPFFPPTDFLQMDAWYDAHQGVTPLFTHDFPYTPLPYFEVLPGMYSWYFPPLASPESALVGCTDEYGNLLGIQDCPTETQLANPITYIDGDETLMHIFHGEVDTLVPNGQSVLLYDALAEAGNEVWFTSVPTGYHDHNSIIGADNYTVYWTNRHGQEEVYEAPDDPAPTWENIENFINYAFKRAQPVAAK